MDSYKTHPLYRHHNIDSAISSLWEFYKSKFLPLFLMSLAMSFIMQLLSTTMDYTQLQNTTDVQVMADALETMIWPITGIVIVSLFFNLLMSYYILYNPISTNVNFFTSILHSLKYFIPYLAVILIILAAGSLIIGLGLMILVVGVILSVLILVTVYMFIAPVMIIERTDIIQTLKRTLKLTYTNFWGNIGWVTVLILIILVISIGMSAMVLLPFSGGFIKSITNPADANIMLELAKNPVYIILSALAGALTLPLMPVFSFILYFNSVSSIEEESVPVKANDTNNRVRVEDLYAKPYYNEDQSVELKAESETKVRVEDLYARRDYKDEETSGSGDEEN